MFLLGLVISAPSPQLAIADELPPPTNPAMFRMTLQGDVRLDALVGYVSQRLGIDFEYDEQIAARKVTIRTPNEIPVQSLPLLLGSVLRTHQLVLVESDTPGWQRIVPAADMTRFTTPTAAERASNAFSSESPASVVTQIFELTNLGVASLADVLKPFLSSDAASVIPIAESNVLIVTDYVSSVKTIADLIRLIDRPAGLGEYLVYEARYLAPQTLVDRVKGLFATQMRTGEATNKNVNLFTEPVGTRIIVAGTADLVRRAEQFLKRLDVPQGLATEVYRIRNTSAERIDRLIKGFVAPPDDETSYQTTVDDEGNLLIVRGSVEVHRQVARLIAELDTAIESNDSPIQFYKLKNASAIDVLYSLLALQEAYGTGTATMGTGAYYSPFGGLLPVGGFAPVGLSPLAAAPMGLQSQQLPLSLSNAGRTPLVPDSANPLARPTFAAGQNASGQTALGANGTPFSGTQSGLANTATIGGLAGATASAAGFAGGGLGGAGLGGGGVATLPGGARVSADVSTNSLIVYAPTNVQSIYAKLIESLDQRRPQVLIEAKVIAIDTTDDFTLGVEISAGDRVGAKRLFKFTSFGLSEVNPDSGALRIIPGLGFNGTLVDPDVADVVVRALARHTRAKVLAAPSILVNDNSTGTLESVTSVPFSSVNASQTVSTTSLGGSQQAGTIITVTPHINEDNHLQLEFDVEFSTFSGTGVSGLPPPRQIDRVGSSVTIPDGKTVVVGGLKRIGENYSFAGIPWAEKIPILRELTSRTDTNQSTTSFFLFIRPLVLRDSRFADLRYISDMEASKACLPGDFPTSRPELIP